MNSPQELAHDFACQRFRESTELMPVKELPSPAYDFDPEGWDMFAVCDKDV